MKNHLEFHTLFVNLHGIFFQARWPYDVLSGLDVLVVPKNHIRRLKQFYAITLERIANYNSLMNISPYIISFI